MMRPPDKVHRVFARPEGMRPSEYRRRIAAALAAAEDLKFRRAQESGFTAGGDAATVVAKTDDDSLINPS